MRSAIDLRAAFVTDSHTAQWLAGISVHRVAADSVSLQNRSSHGGAHSYRDRFPVDVDCE